MEERSNLIRLKTDFVLNADVLKKNLLAACQKVGLTKPDIELLLKEKHDIRTKIPKALFWVSLAVIILIVIFSFGQHKKLSENAISSIIFISILAIAISCAIGWLLIRFLIKNINKDLEEGKYLLSGSVQSSFNSKYGPIFILVDPLDQKIRLNAALKDYLRYRKHAYVTVEVLRNQKRILKFIDK